MQGTLDLNEEEMVAWFMERIIAAKVRLYKIDIDNRTKTYTLLCAALDAKKIKYEIKPRKKTVVNFIVHTKFIRPKKKKLKK